MSDPIKMHCEHCGKGIQAPREYAGKISKCPACGNALYVPTPESEIELLPLAAEDETERQQEALLQAERRRLDSLLAQENDAAEGQAGGGAGLQSAGAPGSSTGVPASAGNRIEQMLLKYLLAVRDADLDAAGRALNVLKLQPRTVRELIDRMATDAMPPAELANIPPAVFQGMLKNLRGKL